MAATEVHRTPLQNGTQQPTSSRFLTVLNYSLSNRCHEICCIIEEGSIKELQAIYPPLIDSIFGLNYQMDWGLKSLSRASHTRDFEIFRQFLAPDGPVLRLVYRLMSDSSIRYDFPVACLPAQTRRALEEGVIPMMYVNKIQLPIQGRMPTVISLNAFEYYMFQFAYYLVNPYNLKVISNWTIPGEAIYPTVVDDYLEFFLPVEGSVVTSLTTSPTSPSSPAVINRICSSISSYANKYSHYTPLNQPFRLLKNGSFTKANIPSPLQLSEQSQMETWLSETIAQIFTEMWLVQNTVENYSTNFMIPSQENFTVNYDHMRTVRMLAKHFHYFTNSYTAGSGNPLEELKRTVIPHLFQKKFYSFLQYSIANWPLDASFRLVLETWLSYIQPWRYLSMKSSRTFYTERHEDKDRVADASWQKFIMENLAFYTVIFQKILPRFFRMDLSTPKNAYMLYRITKVYSQPNLAAMMAEAEANLMDPMAPLTGISENRSSRGNDYSFSNRSSILNPGLVTVVRQQVLELERPGFQYIPLFGEEVKHQVYQLLLIIDQARKTAQDGLVVPDNKTGFFGQFKRALVSLFDSNSYDSNSEDYTPQDHRKVEAHLLTATEQLCTIFNVEPPFFGNNYPREDINSSSSLVNETLPNDSEFLFSRLRGQNITFQGNPDVQPIRSFEYGFLVRLLYQLSQYINGKYRPELRHLYHRKDFLGEFCKIFLAKPLIYYEFDKGTFPPTRQQKVLPARVNFRPLAQKQVIGYALAFVFVGWIWGFHPIFTVLFLLGVILFVSIMRASVTYLKLLKTGRAHSS